MPRKGEKKKRERDEGAESAAKRRGRASEGDVAMKLGEELGEWTVIGLAGIIISKIQDVDGEFAEPQKRAEAYLTLLLCLLCVARTLTHDIVTGESSGTSGKSVASVASDEDEDTDEDAAAAAAAPRPPSADFYVQLFELAKIIITVVDDFEDSVYGLPDSTFVLERAVPQYYGLKAAVRKLTIAGRTLLARASSCAKNKDQKTELIEYWNLFLDNLPRVLLPPLLADPDANAQAAAAEGNTFIELKDAKKWFFIHKPESGESRVEREFFRGRLTRVSHTAAAAAARSDQSQKQLLAGVQKTSDQIVALLGENTPKAFAARFGQLEKKVAKEARRNKKIEKMLMTIAPRVKGLYLSQFPADHATQKADDAASDDDEAATKKAPEENFDEEISDDEDELTFTGKKNGLVTPPPPPQPLAGAARDSSSLGVSRLMVTTD